MFDFTHPLAGKAVLLGRILLQPQIKIAKGVHLPTALADNFSIDDYKAGYSYPASNHVLCYNCKALVKLPVPLYMSIVRTCPQCPTEPNYLSYKVDDYFKCLTDEMQTLVIEYIAYRRDQQC